MDILTLLYRDIKWRFHNVFTIVITILQPMLWLVLYSAVAGQSMKGIGISNYTAFFISGLTYAFSLCLPNEVIYETIMNAIVLPIFFLSTALFPSEGLSGGLAAFVNLNPFTHVINVLRTLILQGNINAHKVVFVIILLVIMCSISFSWALHRLKKETVL